MRGLRTFMRSHIRLAALIVAAALVLRIAVPGGFMPQLAGNAVAISICHGSGSSEGTLVIPGTPAATAKGGCAFADLQVPGLIPVDPLLLAGALAFILTLWLVWSQPVAIQRARHLRPPLRGPPSHL